MQAKVADMYVALNSARAYVYAVAQGRAMPALTTRFDAAGAILLASENAVKVALEAIQALGGAGYTKEWPVERFLRDAKLYDIGAGTNEIRRFLIGAGADRRVTTIASLIDRVDAGFRANAAHNRGAGGGAAPAHGRGGAGRAGAGARAACRARQALAEGSGASVARSALALSGDRRAGGGRSLWRRGAGRRA